MSDKPIQTVLFYTVRFVIHSWWAYSIYWYEVQCRGDSN